jgi:hypothetical protein
MTKTCDGSVATLAGTCNLVNIHNVPATHNSGSNQIDFAFISYAATEFVFRCGILYFNSLFSINHRPLFIGIDILHLLGYPVQGTVKSLECDLKINDPRLVEVYQAPLFQQPINHNVASRIDSLYIVDITAWPPGHKNKFNQIDRDVEHSMKCVANACR